MMNIEAIKNTIAQLLQVSTDQMQMSAVQGGSINQAYSIITEDGNFFCKINDACAFPQMMEKEKNGIELIQKQDKIRVPKVIDARELNGIQFLLMEYIAIGNRPKTFWEKFGEQLAGLHKITNETFGLHENNYMGSLPQDNSPNINWSSFFMESRIMPQIRIAVDTGKLSHKQAAEFENLYPIISQLFQNEKASLLHGDLWSGNFLCDENESPVLIDPAVYYGSRHMDLAMTTLFGGFDSRFYESYHYHFPLPENYKTIWKICNLYPLLIHLNLFGRSYLGQVLEVLEV